MSQFAKKPTNEYKRRRDRGWTFQKMVETMSGKPFEQVKAEQLAKRK